MSRGPWGSSRSSLGSLLRSLGDHRGSSWGYLGSSWASLGLSWAPLGLSWVSLGVSWASLGLAGATLGPISLSWNAWGDLGAVLMVSWTLWIVSVLFLGSVGFRVFSRGPFVGSPLTLGPKVSDFAELLVEKCPLWDMGSFLRFLGSRLDARM